MRLTSGGRARPFRSFSAGTTRAAAPASGTAIAPPGLEVETADGRLAGAALSTAAPCLAGAFTGLETTSSYPQRSHCQEGSTSIPSCCARSSTGPTPPACHLSNLIYSDLRYLIATMNSVQKIDTGGTSN